MQERFVGTIVVVALAILLIPVWLDGPESPAAGQQTAEPPDAVESRTIHLDAEERRPVAVPADAGKAPAPAPEPPAEPPASSASVVAEPPGQAVARPTVQAAPRGRPVEEAERRLPAEGQPDAGWAVQVGSFTSSGNAEKLAASLKARGFPAFVSPHEQGGRTLLRVRVGPEHERPHADALAARLKDAGYHIQIVRQP